MQKKSGHSTNRKLKLNTFLAGAMIFFFPLAAQCQEEVHLPRPGQSQLKWQDAEIGVLFSYDLHVFDGERYNQQQNRITPVPDANIFDPEQLDTDQWIRAARDAGARFAVLTVTHETGFALFQSEVNPYCMKAIRYQDGKGDIVREFVNSCRKYGILPGIYVGIRWNSFLGVYDFRIEGNSQFVKNRQLAYKHMCEGMVEELCTRYGELFLIWFDGGADDPSRYGADVLPIVMKHQPECLFYHNAQRADFRWGGSETGTVPYPCWATFPFPFSHSANQEAVFADNFALLKHGDKEGKFWMPAMSDAPLRSRNNRHEWFWEPGDEANILTVEDLMDMYIRSVGRNSTLILGLTPDDRGLLPRQDVERLQEFGREVQRTFSHPAGSTGGTGMLQSIWLGHEVEINYIMVQEDIEKGERVRSYIVEALVNNNWTEVGKGTCIGHKRIQRIERVKTPAVRLRVVDAVAEPRIRNFSIFLID